ncbi:tetratricopeptide repeat protein [Leptolyngbya sp. FACHB-671]|uniref:tetratricopeptide repeat protein n=1 Tax=Leptolyngbya sp. FACHB-671 TaxID=2692812 RepID=UPI001688A715|nr:tetratricopeptide repeat protein [Leptolyngbya sp. FACHB-671]MBD2068662.1 tetratricopeptide repeat protein [Leptolyngbya sp. FACHB-671]
MSNYNGSGKGLSQLLQQTTGAIIGTIGLVTSVVGFFQLVQGNAGLVTMLSLILGVLLLLLTCLYYACFWKPEEQDKSPSIITPYDDRLIQVQRAKEQRRKTIRRSARIGILAILFLMTAGVVSWQRIQNLPARTVVTVVTEFDGPDLQDHRVTEVIYQELREATGSYADTKIKRLPETIKDSDTARSKGEKEKAAIVIWGWYSKSAEARVSTNFEVLKPPKGFPELGQEAKGQIRTFAVAELDHFILQNRLSAEMAYLTLFTVGMMRYTAGDWDSAIVLLNEALKQAERQRESVLVLDRSIVLKHLADACNHKRYFECAVTHYTQAIEIISDSTLTSLEKGIFSPQYLSAETTNTHPLVLLSSSSVRTAQNWRSLEVNSSGGRFHNAESSTFDLNSYLAKVYNNRGIAYAQRDNLDQAVSDYEQALQLNRNLSEAYNNLGIAFAKQDNYERTIENYNQAIELAPNDALAYNNRGNVYFNQADYEQAIQDYTQAISLNSNYAEAYYNRGNAYLAVGDYKQAIVDYNKAIELNPNLALAYNERGIAYAGQGNYQQAIDDLNKLIELNPNDALAYYNRGTLYAHISYYQQAIDNYNKAIELNPNNALAYRTRGLAYFSLGNHQQAIDNYNKAIELNPNDALAYYH